MLHSLPGVPLLFLRKDKECKEKKDKVQTTINKAEGGAQSLGSLFPSSTFFLLCEGGSGGGGIKCFISVIEMKQSVQRKS